MSFWGKEPKQPPSPRMLTHWHLPPGAKWKTTRWPPDTLTATLEVESRPGPMPKSLAQRAVEQRPGVSLCLRLTSCQSMSIDVTDLFQSSFDCSTWEVPYVHCILLLDQANKKLFSIAHCASSNRFICASTSKSVSSVAGHCACAKLTNLRLQDMEQQKILAAASNQSVAVLTSKSKNIRHLKHAARVTKSCIVHIVNRLQFRCGKQEK